MPRLRQIVSNISPEGGFLVTVINNTGAVSIKGTVVEASVSVEFAVDVAETTDPDTTGVVYDNGVPNGGRMRIVVMGPADVLLEDNTEATRGNWVRCSTVQVGRADATIATPPLGGQVQTDSHFTEIGHCLQSVTAGTNKLCRVFVHHN